MLLEVLVAFLIAALALDVLYGQGIGSLVAARAAGSYQEAISRARSRLAALDGSALVPGDQDGNDGSGFHWHTRIVPLASLRPARAATVASSAYARGTALYDVWVTVSWHADASPRAITLHTQKLGPASG